MTDIYHALLIHDLSWAEDDVVEDRHNAYFAAGSAIDSALRIIVNLVLEADESEGYTDEMARRDLILTGDVLRSLPRMAQVLKQNGRIAALELQKRQGGGLNYEQTQQQPLRENRSRTDDKDAGCT